MDKIIVGLKRPLGEIEFIEIENDYDSLVELVGGELESLQLENYNIYLDSMGKYKPLAVNLNIIANTVVGNAVITRLDDETGEELSLTSDDQKRVSELISEYMLRSPSEDVNEILKNMNLGLSTFLFKNYIEEKVKESSNNFHDLEETLEFISCKYLNSDLDKYFVLDEALNEILGSDIFLKHLLNRYDLDVLYSQFALVWDTLKLRLSYQLR